MTRSLALAAILCGAPALIPGFAVVHASEAKKEAAPATKAIPTKAEIRALITPAQNWLLKQAQPDGSFLPGNQFKLGITELAALGLLDSGIPKTDPRIQKAVEYILARQQPDGGIYEPSEGYANYGTAIGLKVLTRVGADAARIKKAQEFIFGAQNTDEKAVAYGGMGYGSRGGGNEDLSNTAMAIEALRASGVPADHPVLQRALKFVTRCQHLSSHNDMPWARNNGGGVYSPDSSMALGSFHDGSTLSAKPASGAGGAVELTPYGSMTYALISSYIYLDVKPDDPRVKAALRWANANYNFDVNPGMAGQQRREGLFYFYNAMARTYDLLDVTTLDLGKAGKTDWRPDLLAALKARVVKDETDPQAHFWVNDMPRWAEGVPHLTTSYMLQALSRLEASVP
jgi:squalene-hopene/tetraprenyl-beta-curcumene cyclase